MSQSIRVCLVGAGRVARVHANSLVRHVPVAQLVAIVDPNKKTLDEAGEMFGITTRYETLNDGLESTEFDAVVITTYTEVANFKGAARGVDTEHFYDTAIVNLRFESGGLGSISSVCPCDYGYDARVEIIGERGIMQIGELKGQAVVVCTNRDQGLITPIYRTWPQRFEWAYIREMEHFVACIATGQPPRVGGHEGRWAVAGVLAATKSLLEERPVLMREIM